MVSVGTVRRPKVEALRQALDSFRSVLSPEWSYEIVSRDVRSGVSHTPLSRYELMAGARNRAAEMLRIAREGHQQWSYFVGLEGGLDVMNESGRRWAFLESWAFVTDGETESFGRSGATPMPEELVRQVVDNGVELGKAIDAFAGGAGIRDAEGAWGVLTHNLITRQDAFRVAIISAFAPFLAIPRPI